MNGTSIASQRTAHLGKILSNVSLLGMALCLASLASILLLALYYVFLIMILLGTLFLILVYYPDFMKWFETDAIQAAITKFESFIPIIAPVTLAIAAVSIVLLAVSKQKGNTARIVFTSIALVVSAAFTILYHIGG